MSHWLARLLSPASIAIVGASERAGSLATSTIQLLNDSEYSGTVYLVNPKYDRLYQQPCFPSLTELPQTPDLVIFVISGLALERSFDEALHCGVGGIVIYASNYLHNDSTPKLTERLKARAREAGVPVIGGNSMGFYNYDESIFVSFDRPPLNRPGGHIGLILHSGSAMTYLANNDERFCFNYVIASAQEINATVADYIDYLLDQPSTRVIAIFLETVRDVPGFVAALERACRLQIPVVITKVGRTEKSARFALSHSGAIIGDHQAFVALCQRYGVLLCDDADEMIASAMLFAAGFRVSSRGIASMLDSGGMREQMIDLAEDCQLEFAAISTETTAVLEENLEAGLEAVNPMDGMGALNNRIASTYLECGKALLDDPATALLTLEFEFRDGFSHYPELLQVARDLHDYSDKPVILLNSCGYTCLTQTAAEFTQQGIPVINGIQLALRALRNLVRYQPQSLNLEWQRQIAFEPNKLIRWAKQLSEIGVCDEITSLRFFADFDLPCVPFVEANSAQQLLAEVQHWDYPLVLKTAMPGIAHKSDLDGVKVGINNRLELGTAYQDLQRRLGNRVVVMPMVTAGVEVSLGMKNDPHYGPMLILACGGVLIELLNQRACRLAPVNADQANAMIDELKLADLLAGVRGQPALDRAALVTLMQRFSELIVEFSASIAEIDLNPVIVNRAGCIIVDALVVAIAEPRE